MKNAQLFLFFIISISPMFTIKTDFTCLESSILESYLQKNKTHVFIELYQNIWLTNKKKLEKKGKIKPNDSIIDIINYLTTPSPAEILADQNVLVIVKKILNDQTYCTLHKKAERLTKEKNKKKSRAAWSKCRIRMSEICADELKKQNVILDIREQKKEPFYDPKFDISKANKINRFLLLNNKNINKPELVMLYLKAGLVITAIEHQKGEAVLFNTLERFYLAAKKLVYRK